MGNVFASNTPPHQFKGFLLGPFTKWAAKRPDAERGAARDIADRYPMFDTTGKQFCEPEFKVAREYTGKIGPATSESDVGPFSFTLGVVMSGTMLITLIDRATSEERQFSLGPGDFLEWPGSTHTHTWRVLSESVVVTLRWPEPKAG
jgi:hypothetical protein